MDQPTDDTRHQNLDAFLGVEPTSRRAVPIGRLAIGLAILAALVILWRLIFGGGEAASYVTRPVVRGDLTVVVSATASRTGASSAMAALVLPGVLLAGLGFRRRRRALMVLTVAGVTGCGSYGGGRMSPQPTTESFSITANAGSVSHTTMLTLNVQ